MNLLLVLVLFGGVGYGVENEFKIAKAYKSYNECREANPKFHNTMTQWKYDPCNAVAYYIKNKEV